MEEEEEATAAASPKDLVQVAMPSSPTNSSATNAACWVVGARLESKARDSNGGEQWFPAKVLEVEANGRGVLVHYMQWNARHDEWIPSNSSRLRPATTSGSGKSSRHNSGGSNDLEQPIVPATMPAHKDFKSGEKVMATWKLNRKYLATVIKFEPLDGTYLVEFYDGVQCNVKPNNMRRPRKGEEDVDQQESLRINGAADNGSAENSDNEDSPTATSGRRERKRKFDVKKLLNIRSVKSLRSNSKEDDSFLDESSLNNSLPATTAVASGSDNKRKRRPERSSLNSQPKEPSSTVINGGKTRTKSIGLEDGPALAAVSGKRERRKKKFWDDEVDPSTVITSSAVNVNSSSAKAKDLSSSALKRKSSTSVSNPIPKKSVKKSEKVANNVNEEEPAKSNGSSAASQDHHDLPTSPMVDSNDQALSKDKPSGKENGKLLPYLQLDLSSSAELIAEKMIEGVNIPGMGQPIPVDSSSLPEGWEKRVIQRRIGITKGKWDVFITNPETGKSFRSKTELQKHLDERKLPYTSDAFDFSLDDNLKKLRQIWKQYKVKPFLNNPKGPANTNFKHVPAKITQVQDGEVTPPARNNGSKNSSSVSSVLAAANASLNSAAANVNSKSGGPSSTVNSAAAAAMPAPSSSSDNDLIDMACLAEIAVESETGQGLRCSKCGKLFRNDRLLRQHVKHYHPKVYESLLCKHPQIGDDISEPTSPDNRRLSEGSDFFLHDSGNSERRRIPSSESYRRTSLPIDENCTDQFEFARMKKGGRSIKKSSLLDEEAPLSSIYEAENDEDSVFANPKRSRNDSVLSSVTSDTEELSVGEHQLMQHQQRHSCPPTPPTFRLSKRRQAQMRKRIQQPVVRVSKIEDTPLGREYRDELLSMASTSSAAAAVFASSNTTSPTNVNTLDSTLTVSSYPPSEMDASIAGSEHLTSEELVNCTCRRVEEDGLMIQCDICLCWQHGYCIGLEDEDPVPEKHVCETCRQPTGGRTEARFSLDQDWLKEGKLPSCEAVLGSGFVKNKSSSAIMDRETAFRKLSELMADLANLDKVLHGLRVKLHVASQPSNSKVFMWSSIWSVPTHQPMTVEDEDDLQPTPLVPPPHEASNSEAINRTAAIDPHIVAERLSLLANNAAEAEEEKAESKLDTAAEEPVVNGIKDSSSPPPIIENPPEEETETNESSAKTEEASKSTEITSQPELEPAADSSNAELKTTEKTDEQQQQQQPLTNGNAEGSETTEEVVNEDNDDESSHVKKMVSQNGTADDDAEEASSEHFDASFIPSVSEVERLLPSVIQEIASSKNNSSTTSPSTSNKPAESASNSVNFVPEPKRLDRDECRLNLLQHIESVQAEIDKRYNAIESALAKIEAMPGASNAGFSLKQANDSDAKLKAKLNKLIQDLAVARHLVWTL